MEKTYTQTEVDQMLAACIERCAMACIDMPQSDGSTYTYWPCVEAIRALALRDVEKQQGKP